MVIKPAAVTDWPAIERIYRAGIRTGHATFSTEADIPDGSTWFAGKIDGLAFKAIGDHDEIIGWAALSPVSSRCVYEGVAELSVYVAPEAMGHGVGSALLAHLIGASEMAGIWTLQASIFPENVASIHLHEKYGFRIVGRREKIGRHHGVWRDTILMERRSPKI
ncbi:MAG: N-acetyltransferase family protein [Anaerolineae bacterium]|nr:N-acetyltransferase family protein [Anaerolineae bacterium]